MYIGRYYHSIEEKGRLSLPKKFRLKTRELFIVTRGLDGGLFVYPEETWEQTISDLTSKSFTKKKHRDFIRLMTNDAQEVEVDRLGRIRIPEYLREYAKLEKDVVIVGSLKNIEIWDTKTYHQYIENIEKDAESIAEGIEDVE